MPKVLVPMPYKPTLHPKLVDMMLDNLEALTKNNPLFDIEIGFNTDPEPRLADERVWAPVGRIRNKTIARFLRPEHDYVLWIDADIVQYPADLLTQLYQVNPKGITAPMVLIQGCDTFYDTAGFVTLSMQNAVPQMPYWPRDIDSLAPFALAGVGACYLMPAWPYQRDIWHQDTPWTDHWPMMEAIRQAGEQVLALPGCVVYHAHLPSYGENWH
jgi:hypothetical protein